MTPKAKSNLPLMLTLGRIAAGPVVAALVLWAAPMRSPIRRAFLIYAAASIVFILAALTDWLDGYLARKYDAVTPLGAALDHCADKVLVACALLALAYAALPLGLVAAGVVILARDIAVAGLREGMSASGKSLPVSWTGKWKAAAEMAGVGACLLLQTAALADAPFNLVFALSWAALLLLWTAAALALLSGAHYAAAAAKQL